MGLRFHLSGTCVFLLREELQSGSSPYFWSLTSIPACWASKRVVEPGGSKKGFGGKGHDNFGCVQIHCSFCFPSSPGEENQVGRETAWGVYMPIVGAPMEWKQEIPPCKVELGLGAVSRAFWWVQSLCSRPLDNCSAPSLYLLPVLFLQHNEQFIVFPFNTTHVYWAGISKRYKGHWNKYWAGISERYKGH